MNLIKINLNQTISKAQLKEIKQEKDRWIVFGIICALFIASISWFYFLNNKLYNIISERELTIEKIVNETK